MSNEVLWRRGPSLSYSYLPWINPWVDFAENPKHVRHHEYFIPPKFNKYPSSSSVVKTDYVFH